MSQNTKHTPGPLTFRPAYQNGQPAGFVVQAGVNALAAVNTENDARLFAAAPDLLEACNQTISDWHADPANFNRVESLGVQMSRAAIAKAGGAK